MQHHQTSAAPAVRTGRNPAVLQGSAAAVSALRRFRGVLTAPLPAHVPVTTAPGRLPRKGVSR